MADISASVSAIMHSLQLDFEDNNSNYQEHKKKSTSILKSPMHTKVIKVRNSHLPVLIAPKQF